MSRYQQFKAAQPAPWLAERSNSFYFTYLAVCAAIALIAAVLIDPALVHTVVGHHASVPSVDPHIYKVPRVVEVGPPPVVQPAHLTT